ncbi:hypothetical protein BN988_02792 [Oceanobacillus picturae]|uniref:Uncharacterized protein n=1 Tax=Oceanobacillus picturae TaxID=171693 RepID=W9BD60_9BACI|nr:hypothetical protein BN988_02792 [Oceanobacillus picturae]
MGRELSKKEGVLSLFLMIYEHLELMFYIKVYLYFKSDQPKMVTNLG